MNDLASVQPLFPLELPAVGLTLALSFLLGAEREEHRDDNPLHYLFGGIRTFPLIGLSGYVLAHLSLQGQTGERPYLLAAGLLVLGALLFLSYQKKLQLSSQAGMTSEISAVFTYLMGALVCREEFWLATALTVIALMLLELKQGLEKLAKRVPGEEIFTLTRFLLLSAVILPIVPNEDLGQFGLNPHKIWLIVVAISGLSYLAYGAGKLFGAKRGVIASAVFGGLYSSTLATVILTRNAREGDEPRLYSGCYLISSSLMYFRVIALLALFSHELTERVLLPFSVLGGGGFLVGALLAWTTPQSEQKATTEASSKRNPLELKAAGIFVVFFLAMTVLTKLAQESLGRLGVYGLAFLSGLYDVNPFIMSLTQKSSTPTPFEIAASAIVIATASNNVAKTAYIYSQCPKSIGKKAAFTMGIFSILGFASLFYW